MANACAGARQNQKETMLIIAAFAQLHPLPADPSY
jgi:hypothetical protein